MDNLRFELRQERLSEVDWPSVFDRLHEGLVIAEVVRENETELNWRYLHVNEAWSRLTGLSSRGIAGKLVTEVIPGVETHWVEDFARVATDQQPQTFVGPVSELGRTYDIRAFPVSHDRFGLLFLDVTEREKNEVRLKERAVELENKIKAELGVRAKTWDVSPDIQVVANHLGYFEQCNPAMTAILGWTQQDLAYIPFPDLVHPDDLDDTLRAFEAGKNNQPVLRFVNRYRHRNGDYRWLSWVSVPNDGKIYATARDITEEKAREAELELRRAERSKLWSASPDLHLILSLEGRYLEASNSWELQLGYAPAALKGELFDALIVDEDKPYAHDLFAILKETGQVDHSEIRMLDAQGNQRWYGWTAVVSGDVIFATGRNVDERRKQDQQLKQAEEALAQSRKIETLGQLTGGVAHDFNNLLAAIQSSLKLLQKHVDTDSEQAAALLQNALAGADRGKRLVQHMLAFAKKQELAPKAVDLRSVQEMDQLLRSSAGPGIEISYTFAPDLPAALVDASQLEMAILNLAVNARDALDGQGRLSINVTKVEKDVPRDLPEGDYLSVSVIDDGPGMDEQTLSQATEPFFTTKGVGKGTGLGLSMVHGLAKQSGGAFRLKSAPGKGTTAEILLPSTSERPAVIPDRAASQQQAVRYQDSTLRILVVDDDVLVLMGTVGVLEDMGHDVLDAANGHEALSLLSENSDIDLIITDQGMPGMTGVQLSEKIAAQRPDIPIILCTGYGELPEGSYRHMAARLAKPFADKQLADVIAKAIKSD
jgi:PAS domain S-box-containing protein